MSVCLVEKQEQATQVKHELEELQREKEVLTAEILQELGIRCEPKSWFPQAICSTSLEVVKTNGR